MRFYLFSLSLLLLLSGCGSSPDVALTPKLSHYATAQQQCSDFIEGKSELTGKVEKECEQFVKRLDIANSTANQLASGTLKKGEKKQTKIRYSRERNKLEQAYETLSASIKEATLETIKKDDIENFQKAIAFPGNSFTSPYYKYMKSKAPLFDDNVQYLDYQRKESQKLMLKAQHNLKKGREKKALVLFEQAANLGNVQAARSTGLLYEKSDRQKAIMWHTRAAEGGIKASYLNLGRLYEADAQKEPALEWYLRSAAQNSAKAQYRLYLYYLDQDRDSAISWLQKSAANGYAHAQYSYALILMSETKTDEAISLLQQASQNNYPQASDYLGAYYYNLNLFDSAFTQLSQSESANSFYLRAKMLEEGVGTQRDYKEAYTFYTRASALGTKNIDNDLKRVNKLLSKEQQQKAAEEKKKQLKQMAAMTKECGAIPNNKSIKKQGKRFHILGTASAPVGRSSYIIYGNDGEDYYVLRARGVREDDRVDISVMSTGSTASISSADDDEVDIYQFTFIKECIIEEEQ